MINQKAVAVLLLAAVVYALVIHGLLVAPEKPVRAITEKSKSQTEVIWFCDMQSNAKILVLDCTDDVHFPSR